MSALYSTVDEFNISPERKWLGHDECAVEQSEEKDTATLSKKLEVIARAYDPCISCSVHLVSDRHVE
ncbi:MAG: hypothetical protein HKM89_13530 [Gemmatimonadales bacterium]|nr:hypothetical protein [Gemmatimonadales bacterium]